LPNSIIKGTGEAQGIKRIFITNSVGQVIREVTPLRSKSVTPGVGLGPKEIPPPSEDIKLLNFVFGS